jgi:Zn-finger protein
MKREIFEKALECFCPGAKIESYKEWSRNKLDENDKWVKDCPAIFVVIKYETTNEVLRSNKLSEQLSDLLGCEIIIEEGSNLNYLD